MVTVFAFTFDENIMIKTINLIKNFIYIINTKSSIKILFNLLI